MWAGVAWPSWVLGRWLGRLPDCMAGWLVVGWLAGWLAGVHIFRTVFADSFTTLDALTADRIFGRISLQKSAQKEI